jgi:flagellar motor switch protein FliN/FliY
VTDQTIKPGAAAASATAQNAPVRRINTKLIDAVEVTLDGFLGSASMTVAELSALREGGVITLDAALNAPVELRLNGVAVARGELVAVGDRFAVRLTEISS